MQLFKKFKVSNIAMQKPHCANTNCKFWSDPGQKCVVSKSGLFIPLDDHIKIYCKTSEHVRCIQYNMQIQLTQQTDDRTSENRRKYLRVKENRTITLVRLNESGNIVSYYPEKAHILDLSVGGMRVNSRKLLLNDSIVHFSFKGDDTIDDVQPGIAKVRWSFSTSNDTLYQVGLEFQSEQTIEAIGNHLGLNA